MAIRLKTPKSQASLQHQPTSPPSSTGTHHPEPTLCPTTNSGIDNGESATSPRRIWRMNPLQLICALLKCVFSSASRPDSAIHTKSELARRFKVQLHDINVAIRAGQLVPGRHYFLVNDKELFIWGEDLITSIMDDCAAFDDKLQSARRFTKSGRTYPHQPVKNRRPGRIKIIPRPTFYMNLAEQIYSLLRRILAGKPKCNIMIVTRPELAKRLKVTPRDIHQAIRAGQLKPGRHFFMISDKELFIWGDKLVAAIMNDCANFADQLQPAKRLAESSSLIQAKQRTKRHHRNFRSVGDTGGASW